MSDIIDLASFTLFRQGMITITDSMGFFEALRNQSLFQTYPKCVSRRTWITQLNKKTSQKNNYLKAITVLKKEGVGPARYDQGHRFNGFYYAFPYMNMQVILFYWGDFPSLELPRQNTITWKWFFFSGWIPWDWSNLICLFQLARGASHK